MHEGLYKDQFGYAYAQKVHFLTGLASVNLHY